MKYIKAALVFFTVILVSGCMGKEPNDLAYVVALGFDKAPTQDNYIMTLQFARPTNISGVGGESGGSGQEIVENIAVEAPNIYAGINLANHIVSKKFSLAHSKLIVFSEEIAREGIADIMETLARNEEMRPDIFMAVSLGSARDYLFDVQPIIEVNPSRYYQLIYSQNYSSGVPENTAESFYFNEKSGAKDNVLPLAGTIKPPEESESENGGEKGGSESSGESGSGEGTEGKGSEESLNMAQQEAPQTEGRFEFRLRDYIAGQVAVNQNNKGEAMGMAYFSGDKVVGITGSVETELYKMLVGRYKESYMTLMCDKENAVTVRAMGIKEPRYVIDRDKKTVEITIFFESDLYSLPTDYLAESGIEGFERAAKDEIKEAAEKFINETIKPAGVDLLGLKEKFKTHFLTNEQYENEKDEVMDYDVFVNVEFRIRRTGLTVKEAGE